MNLPRCEALPLPDFQVSFRIDKVERLRWYSSALYTRPFFYPLIGPAGQSLLRIGHSGAPDHDHQRGIWFAHQKVSGVDFWVDDSPARIRQKQWLCYEDGDEARMAVLLDWFDGHNPKELMEQELIVEVRPGPAQGETFVELQSTFRPTAEKLELGKTSLGFLGVRVAKTISASFGGGKLTGSNERTGEAALLDKPSLWMDFSGPVTDDAVEGITVFDHKSNPTHPVTWHVRDNGWIGAATCHGEAISITKTAPLVLRYLIYAHAGEVNADKSLGIIRDFNATNGFEVMKAMKKDLAWMIRRV